MDGHAKDCTPPAARAFDSFPPREPVLLLKCDNCGEGVPEGEIEIIQTLAAIRHLPPDRCEPAEHAEQCPRCGKIGAFTGDLIYECAVCGKRYEDDDDFFAYEQAEACCSNNPERTQP